MSSGIQSLLRTEKEAAEIETEARKYRTNRLKAAKSDAQKEIDEYKKQKEAELKEYELKHAGLNESEDKVADEKVKVELDSIKAKYQQKKSEVIDLLVKATIEANPEIHINASQ